jgi:5-methylcytosine-specific restriction endonuclease McrA
VIYVAKPRNGAPTAFLAAAEAEMKTILPRLEAKHAGRVKVSFSAYRHQQLKDALEALFHRKCAYCEALYSPTGNLEVEHYRPKSIYYWLAADWSNLLPSCNRCNNGKRSHFPLADPKRQARRRGEEVHETPLLLNPSDARPSRRPEKHLSFDTADGSIAAIAVRGVPSPLGVTSIRIYRLTRPALSALRRDWAKRVRCQLLFRQAAQQGRLTAQQRRAADDGVIDLLRPDQPFRGLTFKILRESGITRATSTRKASPK